MMNEKLDFALTSVKLCNFNTIQKNTHIVIYREKNTKLYLNREETQRDQDVILIYLMSHFSSTYELGESLRYCCLSAFPPSLMVTFNTVIFFPISQAWPPHMHTHIREGQMHLLMYPHTFTWEKEVLMSDYCHYGMVTQWNKLDLHDFNVLDGKWNK